MPHLTKFKIQHFRQFENTVTVPMRPITMLIGANNSGKSTILQALNVFQFCLENCLVQNSASGKKLTLKKQNIGADDMGRLPIASPTDLWPNGRTSKPIVLAATYSDGTELKFELSLSHNLFNISPAIANCPDEQTFLASFRIQFVPIFSGLLPREELLTEVSRGERLRAQRHADIVRNLLLDLRRNHSARWRLLVSLIQRLYPQASLDVTHGEQRVLSPWIDTQYHDNILTKDRDVITSGSGFHQAMQIFLGVLQPGISLVLLDEPDSHLHARLQHELMQIFEELAEKEALQFVIATHSPHLLRAAPPGSLFVCRDGTVGPLANTPQQLETLERVGAFDQMELVPLLQSARVCFVESSEDRDRIRWFAQKHLGDAKADQIFRGFSFLFTHQEPVSARVSTLARQVRDLLTSAQRESNLPQKKLSVLALGDRDYRTDAEIKAAKSDLKRAAQQPGLGFDFDLHIWTRNELENYLIDLVTLKNAITACVEKRGKKAAWDALENEFDTFHAERIADQRQAVTERIADLIQNQERQLAVQNAMNKARDRLNKEWGDGVGHVDAKVILSESRKWLQDKGVPCNLHPREIIQAMTEVPGDVKKFIAALKKLTAPPHTPKAVKQAVQAKKKAS
jgi:predicted ATPase